MDEAMKLVLPLPMNLANSRLHWRVKNKRKREYFELLDALLMTRNLPDPPAKPWKKARIKVHAYLWSPQDEDNLMARLKWPVDWLRNAGYVVDDRKKNLIYAGIPEQSIDRKHTRLEITLVKA